MTDLTSSLRAQWLQGHGVIAHTEATAAHIDDLLVRLGQEQPELSPEAFWRRLLAADRLVNAAMWVVVHMTYARRVRTDGAPLAAEDFKPVPEGHTGGALNMVPAYVGYLLANALSGHTRSWLMEQGHCVAAIDAVNVLTGNMHAAHAARYAGDDAGLTRLVNDFYSYAIGPDGRPASPLGSHVNAHTGGGIMEGGYLGFAGLQYVHMPLPGQRLVAFLSDGAFEEQRGPDWAPRWWRAEDSGLVAPIMIANGRRIDQRTTMTQSGGTDWFQQHLTLNGFEPIVIDGRDPAAFAWAILAQEHALDMQAQAVRAGSAHYPVRLPYAIAETIKGFGFPGAGTNSAHNLPLPGNPHRDPESARLFNEGAGRLYVHPDELAAAVASLNTHAEHQRPREKDHPLAAAVTMYPRRAELPLQPSDPGRRLSPMAGIDAAFTALVEANPQLRVRVGNPDEIRSNRLNCTLDLLRHRVTAPEAGIAEAVDGSVITALNEEAITCAALANKQGLNLIVTYEAFAVKMLGSLRQEIIFSRHRSVNGDTPGWLSVPVLLSSHTWENGKNEQSHQDPTLCETLLGEMSDTAPVYFPPDWNSAIATLDAIYQTRGRIAAVVAPKNERPLLLSIAQASELVRDGVLRVAGDGDAAVQIFAVGSYQLEQALIAADRLAQRDVACSVWCLLEPGRFRHPRDDREADYTHGSLQVIPHASHRLFLAHMRPESLLGVLRPLDLGPARTTALGYLNRGGTLDCFGMLFANRCTWAHALQSLAGMLGRDVADWLTAEELAAVDGAGDPRVLECSLRC
jgi:phosphoketolase